MGHKIFSCDIAGHLAALTFQDKEDLLYKCLTFSIKGISYTVLEEASLDK